MPKLLTAQTMIVPPDDVVPIERIVNDIGEINLLNLKPFSDCECSSLDDAIKFLTKYQLLANSVDCPTCHLPMKLYACAQLRDGYQVGI